jgi:preprotein translocase subunit YajC
MKENLYMDFISNAMAATGTGATTTGGGWMQTLMLFGPIILIFYFLLFRPQQKIRKQHSEMLAGLKKGDNVINSGGLFGEITGIENNTVTIEIAPKVRVKVTKESISAVVK